MWAITSLKSRDQAIPDERKLVHVLVAVDVVGWRAAGGLESIQLPFDFVGDKRNRQPTRPGAADQPVQRLVKARPRQPLGQVKMQTPINWKVRQLACLVPEECCPRHATDRRKPPGLGQADDSVVDLA